MEHAPFLLLAAAICCVWAPAVRAGPLELPASVLPFAAAAAEGVFVGLLAPVALVSLGLLLASALASKGARSQAHRAVFTTLAISIALVMALHWAPGFANPKLLDSVKLSPDSAAFNQYLNFDKGAAGLVILALYAPRVASVAELGRVLRSSALPVSALIVAVMCLAMLLSYVRPDAKLPTFTLTFLATNLFFTCVAEEAFFRGFLQQKVAASVAGHPIPWWGPALLTGLLFGAAHSAGGSTLFAVACVAGVGYSVVFARVRRIEAPIVAHFAVNAVQFLCFSYPHLA